MLFTSLGKLLAWLTLGLGSLRTGMGLFVASYDDPERYAFAVTRYLGSVSSGESIDRGIYLIAVGVALGVITDISSSVAKWRSEQT